MSEVYSQIEFEQDVKSIAEAGTSWQFDCDFL